MPSQKQQQQIIDIIKLHEKLFFKYSAYVRINNIKNTLNDMRLLIDIIEPFESSLASLDVVDLQIEVALEHFINKQDNFILLSEISSIRKYSKLIKSTHLSDNGKYFYSTGKTLSNKKKTNEFNFKTGVSIPYEGAGMLFKDDTYFVRYHDENSYIARKFGIISDYPLTIYYSIHNKIDGTTSKNIGLKMPKLTLDMLNNFKIICPNQTLEDNFQTLHSLKRKVAKIRKTINCNLDRIISKLLI